MITEATISETTSLRHIVMMQFKEDTSIAEIDEIVRRFVQLKEHIGEVEWIEWGTNNSPEGLHEGLTHCFNLNFRDISDRDVYLSHPTHVAFAEWVGTWVAKVVVFDYCSGV